MAVAALSREEFTAVLSFHDDLDWLTKIKKQPPDYLTQEQFGEIVKSKVEEIVRAGNPLMIGVGKGLQRIRNRWQQLRQSIGQR